MSPTARIVVVATTTSVVLGFVTVFVVVLANESPATIHHHVTLEGVRNLLFIGAFTSLPISVPAGLVGGALAARVATSQASQRSLSSWAGRGAAWGAAAGATGTVALFALPSHATATFALLVVMMAVTGGTTGAVVGAIVGGYCSRVLRLSGVRER